MSKASSLETGRKLPGDRRFQKRTQLILRRRINSQLPGGPIKYHLMQPSRLKVSQLSCVERAYTGCRNPTATVAHRRAVAVVLSRR